MGKRAELRKILEAKPPAKPAPKKGARLPVVESCADCVHSRDRSACFHPNTPGRLDEYGESPRNDGSGHTFRCSRPLPPVPKGEGGFPEYKTPPDWCPLPLLEPKTEPPTY
jgi:hypothetical protein